MALDPRAIPDIYALFANPLRDHELAIIVHDGKPVVFKLEQGALRKDLGNCRYKKPNVHDKCDKQIIDESKMEVENGCGLLSKRMIYDQLILQAFQISHQDIQDRVFYFVKQMENKVKNGKGNRLSHETERFLQVSYRFYKPKKWSGKSYLHCLPEIHPGWMMMDEQQAEIDDDYRISRVIWGSARECPFQDPKSMVYWGYCFGNLDIVIVDLRTKEAIAISSLTLHMIASHKCFQHSKNIYRLHPRKLIRILFRK